MKKNNQAQEWTVGDVFAIEIAPGEYAFGRVLLDIYNQAFKRGYIDGSSYIYFRGEHDILIELFKETSNTKSFDINNAEVLMSSIFTTDAGIELNQWEIIDNVKIDPTMIDFPEFLSHNGAFEGKYIKGEIAHIVEITHEEVEKMHFYGKQLATNLIPKFILHALGRMSELQDVPSNKMHLIDMAHTDLRYSEHRERIYSLLPEEFRMPYYEMAKEKGFDLARLYE